MGKGKVAVGDLRVHCCAGTTRPHPHLAPHERVRPRAAQLEALCLSGPSSPPLRRTAMGKRQFTHLHLAPRERVGPQSAQVEAQAAKRRDGGRVAPQRRGHVELHGAEAQRGQARDLQGGEMANGVQLTT